MAPPEAMGRAGALSIGFVGNCQAELLQRAFAKATPAAQFASFYHFFDLSQDELATARAEICACDVILMQDIRDAENYPLRASLPPHCRIIAFPFLRFASPWPYDDFNGLRDSVARNQDDPALHAVTHYDGILGRLRRVEPDPRNRFEAYKECKFKEMIDPARVHDFETRRLEALDERFGFEIGRHILEGFRKTQLFYTVNRPCGAVLALVLEYIFKVLDLALTAQPDGVLDELRLIQVPVHPFVARRLSIEWADRKRLYRNGDREMNWDGFVRAYIERYG
ncbi:MAG: WcbI family polysaccharide biosynthesis putative acetyltransferase [Xanthobacteraceae bacterium]